MQENQTHTILVMEDEKPLLSAVKTKLEKEGFVVLAARSIEKAMSHLQNTKKVHAIWLDHYLLGKETGLDFVVKIKANEQWKAIPILVVSNTASPDKVQSYLRLGVTKYFTKADFRLDDLIKELKTAIKDSNE